MPYVLTLQLTFAETLVLCNALGNYIEVAAHGSEQDQATVARATVMLREVERALERGPRRDS